MLTLLPTLLLGTATATSSFPAAVADDLGTPCTPPCSLCHVGTPGGGTAVSGFAMSMKDHGLHSGDTTSLQAALDQLDADGVDSDGDGVSDIDELVAGDDPNAAGEALCDVTAPRYGCATLTAPPVGGALIALAPLLLLARRRRQAPDSQTEEN